MSVVKPTWTASRVLAAAWMGVVLAGPLRAQETPEPPETPKLTHAARSGWLGARIIAGRISFTGTRFGRMNSATNSGGRSERLNIHITEGELAVSYELSGPDERLSIEVTGGSQLHIRRSPKGDSSLVPVEFRQSDDKPLQLTVGPKDQQQVYQAASLWHLLIAQPETCRQHLVPLLSVLDEEWDLNTTAEHVEEGLLRAATERQLPDRRRWAELVQQLGDDRFARREAADRKLRALGRVVFTYLQQLDPARLDAEQHYRVRRIIVTLSKSMSNDTPEQIANWLAGDPSVWLAMLSRHEESERRLARQRLEALLGEPIPFDPAADATIRAGQIEQLRARVLGQ